MKVSTPQVQPEKNKSIAAPAYEIEDFIALENYILIRVLKQDYLGGIALPDSVGGMQEDQLGMGRVLSVGPGAVDPKGVMHIPDVKPGDIVFIPFALMPIPFLMGKEMCVICRDTQVCGKMKSHD